MRLQLKINNDWKECEVDNKTNSIVLSWEFDSINDPLKYYSEFSYTFKLSKTETNNKIFDEFQQLDFAYVLPTQYNPTKAMEYILYGDRNDEISKGLANLKEIDESYYYIQLNGSLGVCFSKLLNAGWDDSNTDSDYTLLPDYLKYDGSTFTNGTTLDRSLVLDSWKIDSTTVPFDFDTLKDDYGTLHTLYGTSNEQNAWASSIVGFLPQHQGKYKEFSSDKWVEGGLIKPLFTKNNTDKEKDLGDGVTELMMNQYRSYYQQPYIYVNKLFSIFKEHCKDITDYDLILDDRWFNATEMSDLVYTLKGYEIGKEDEVENTRYVTSWSFNIPLPINANYTASDHQISGLSSLYEDELVFSGNVKKGQIINNTVDVNISLNNPNNLIGSTQVSAFAWNPQSPLYAYYYVIDNSTSTTVYTKQRPILIIPLLEYGGWSQEYPETLSNLYGNAFELLPYYFSGQGGTQTANYGTVQLSLKWLNTLGDGNYDVIWRIGFATDYNPMMCHMLGGQGIYYWQGESDGHYTGGDSNGRLTLQSNNDTNLQYLSTNNRSHAALTMKKLFSSETPFSILLKYCKMNNLVWVVNDVAQTLTIKRKYDYFYDNLTEDQNSYGVYAIGIEPSYKGFYDITDSIDIAKGLTTEPMTYSGDKVSLAFESSDDKYVKGYKEKYSKVYGSLLLTTADENSKNTIQLLGNDDYSKIKPPMVASEVYQTASSIISGSVIKKEAWAMPSNVTDGNEQAGVYGAFYYRNPNLNISSSPFRYWGFRVTDDTPEEVSNDTYCWQAAPNGTTFTSIPQFLEYDRTKQKTLFYGEPLEVYHELPTEVYTAESLYDREFRSYMTDAYSPDNKLIKCYLYISSAIYNRLKINPLVQVKNVVYVIEKMEYDCLSNYATVTLRQIMYVNNLTNNQL